MEKEWRIKGKAKWKLALFIPCHFGMLNFYYGTTECVHKESCGPLKYRPVEKDVNGWRCREAAGWNGQGDQTIWRADWHDHGVRLYGFRSLGFRVRRRRRP